MGFEDFEKLCSSGHRMDKQEKHLGHIDMINALRDYGVSPLQKGVERGGFEPSKRLNVYTLSKRAPSATRPPLQK